MRSADLGRIRLALLALRAVLIVAAPVYVATWLIGDHPAADAQAASRSALDRLTDGLQPDQTTVDALGYTVVLGALALAIGVVLGWAAQLVLRSRGRGRRSGLLAGPFLVLAIPGLAWIPLIDWANRSGLIPADPQVVDSLGEQAARFVVFWATLVGLAVAPTAAALASDRRVARESIAFDDVLPVALSPLSSRPYPEIPDRVGFPSLTFGLALAGAEMLSGYPGIFDLSRQALLDGDLDRVGQVVVAVAMVGVVLTVVMAIASWWHRRRWGSLAYIERPPSRPGGVSKWFVIGATAVLGLVAVAAALEPTASQNTPLLDPSTDGPWLGSDGQGRSVLAIGVRGLFLALVASLVPAVMATAGGLALKGLKHLVGGYGSQIIDGLADVLWWPAAALVPLAMLGRDVSDGSSLELTPLLITGLLLIPPAAWLLHPYVTSGRLLWPRLTTTVLYLAAMALAVHLVAGFAITGSPTVDQEARSLGTQIAGGLGDYQQNPWPVLVPLGLAALVSTGLLWAASLSILVDRLSSAGGPPDPRPVGAGIGLVQTDPDPYPGSPQPELASSDAEAADRQPTPFDQPSDEPARQGADHPTPTGDVPSQPQTHVTATGLTITPLPNVDVGSAPLIRSDSDDELTSTIELRPAELRRRLRESGIEDLDE